MIELIVLADLIRYYLSLFIECTLYYVLDLTTLQTSWFNMYFFARRQKD